MSLSVYLIIPDAPPQPEGSDIFVRENGQTRQISREEWDRLHPGREPVVCTSPGRTGEVYTANITHNLSTMADRAGIYKCLWRPDETGITKARQLIEPLYIGLTLLRSDPEQFKAINPENGWGDYEGLVAFVEGYLQACGQHPDADVRLWR